LSSLATDSLPDGFRVPIHTSLTRPLLLAGVPRAICILNWTFCAALSLPLRTFYAIPLSVFVHAVCFAAARRDPQFWDVLCRSLRYRVFYRA
jgi:type IV secretory pathway TrbD component